MVDDTSRFLSVRPEYVMVPVGGELPATLRLTGSPPDTGVEGIHEVSAVDPDSGAAEKFFVDVVAQQEFQRFRDISARISLPQPAEHLLFLGDSLTDKRRGYNYVDKVLYWLWHVHGAAITARNAGVGGDFISRVWQRLQGVPGVLRPEMYDHLFSPTPSLVFIFLGANDSKLKSVSGYKESHVAADVFEGEYELSVRKILDESDARVVLMSSASSVESVCAARAKASAAEGKAHNLFGRPEELERCNAVVRRTASELGCEYLDVYSPTRDHPDKASLFDPNDGVHLTDLGNRAIALLVLEHLAKSA